MRTRSFVSCRPPDVEGARGRRRRALTARTVRRHGGRVLASAPAELAVFASTTAAVACALDAVATPEFADHSFAVHVADVPDSLDADAGQVSGAQVCEAMVDVAHPGQVLASEPASALVADAEGVVVTDLGSHRLADLGPHRRILQLDRGERRTFHRLRSLEGRAATLPVQLTRFVGRVDELRAIADLLDQERVVTLTGPGGCGKTRLALQAAAGAREEFASGVWFVPLADVPAEPGAVAPAVAAAVLGPGQDAGAGSVEAAAEALASGPALLVIDNCEHVVDAAADVVERLTRACPDLHVLATSRERLGMAGETVWPVPPLSLPVDSGGPAASGDGSRAGDMPPDAARLSDAVRLFVDRAVLRAPTFRPSGEDLSVVVEVCERLDALPLAIELVAPMAASLSPPQILERLDDRLRLSVRGARTAVERQRSLDDAVNWSHELLDETERAVFRRLAVLAGSFGIGVAERLCVGDGIDDGMDPRLDEASFVLILDDLVGKSLVTVSQEAGRFRLLETIRAFAAARLRESGEWDGVVDRLLRWAAEAAAAAEPHLHGPAQAEWVARLGAEADAMHAALRAGLASGDRRVLDVAGTVWRYWLASGSLSAGRRLLDEALSMSGDVPGLPRARARNGSAVLAMYQSDYDEASALAAAALKDVDGDDEAAPLRAAILNTIGGIAHHTGDFDEASRRYEASAELHRRSGDVRNAARALLNLGGVALGRGDFETAQRHWETALEDLRRLRDAESAAHALNNLANLALSRGQTDEAEQRWTEALGIFSAGDDRPGIATIRCNLGILSLERGEVTAARDQLIESLQLHDELGDRRGISGCLRYLAAVAQADEDHIEATVLLAAAEALRLEVGASLHWLAVTDEDPVLVAAKQRLGDEAFSRAWDTGRMTPVGRIVADLLRDGHPDVSALRPTAESGPGGRRSAPPSTARRSVLRREGDVWAVGSGEARARLRSTKGMSYVAELVRRPGTEVHVLELVSAVDGRSVSTRARRAATADDLVTGSSEDLLIDDEARNAYRARLTELQEEIDEAEGFADEGRAARAREEMDRILEQLSASLGLGGRGRAAAGSAERARVNVTKLIRSAIGRIADADAMLGAHLDRSVRTGTFCVYDPGPEPMSWTL